MNNKSKLALRIGAAIISIGSIILFVPWGIVRVWLQPVPDTIQEQVDLAIDHGLDGILVYVDQAGKQPQFFSAGWKNRENKIPADPRALFKIASIDKLYIAVAAAKLVDAGKLSLDDTLDDHLPDIAQRIENSDEISLRMMIQHRSGIPNFTDNPDFPWADPPKSRLDMLSYALDQPAGFQPNAEYAYSNSNYVLITEIMNLVLGFNYHQFIKSEILEPLNLTHTFSSLDEVDSGDVVSGYYVGWEPDVKENNLGSMLATIEDVGIFLRALNDGSVFQNNEKDIYASVYAFEHTGLLPGYSSIARYHPDLDAVVIQFINTSGGNTWPITEIIYNRIMRILAAITQVHD